MPLSKQEKCCTVEKLTAFLPTYGEEVLRESLINCNWDLEKTSLFLLINITHKSVIPQTSRYPSVLSATITKHVSQHLKFAVDNKENEGAQFQQLLKFFDDTKKQTSLSRVAWPLIDFENPYDIDADKDEINTDEWNGFLKSLDDNMPPKNEMLSLQEVHENSINVKSNSSPQVLSFSKMSKQEMDKIVSSAK